MDLVSVFEEIRHIYSNDWSWICVKMCKTQITMNLYKHIIIYIFLTLIIIFFMCIYNSDNNILISCYEYNMIIMEIYSVLFSHSFYLKQKIKSKGHCY